MSTEVLRHIELLFGSIGVILSFFFAFFLILDRKKQPKATLFLAIYLLAFSLRIGKSLFFNYFYIEPIVRNIFLATLLTIGPSLWFYIKFLYHPNIPISKKVYLHYLPFLLYVCFCWAIPNDGSALSAFFLKALVFHMAIYSIYGLYWLYQQKEKQASLHEKKIKKWLFYFVYVTLFLTLIYFLILQGFIPYYLGTAFLFSFAIILFSIWALKNPELFSTKQQKYANSNLKDIQVSAYIEKLNQIMADEKPYLDPNLTLSKLSKKVGITSKQMSQVINQAAQTNYSQYVAKHRVNEAKRLLSAASHENFKIAAIAYDSGFNSLSSFNAAFKKIENITAKEFRQSLQK